MWLKVVYSRLQFKKSFYKSKDKENYSVLNHSLNTKVSLLVIRPSISSLTEDEQLKIKKHKSLLKSVVNQQCKKCWCWGPDLLRKWRCCVLSVPELLMQQLITQSALELILVLPSRHTLSVKESSYCRSRWVVGFLWDHWAQTDNAVILSTNIYFGQLYLRKKVLKENYC